MQSVLCLGAAGDGTRVRGRVRNHLDQVRARTERRSFRQSAARNVASARLANRIQQPVPGDCLQPGGERPSGLFAVRTEPLEGLKQRLLQHVVDGDQRLQVGRHLRRQIPAQLAGVIPQKLLQRGIVPLLSSLEQLLSFFVLTHTGSLTQM